MDLSILNIGPPIWRAFFCTTYPGTMNSILSETVDRYPTIAKCKRVSQNAVFSMTVSVDRKSQIDLHKPADSFFVGKTRESTVQKKT